MSTCFVCSLFCTVKINHIFHHTNYIKYFSILLLLLAICIFYLWILIALTSYQLNDKQSYLTDDRPDRMANTMTEAETMVGHKLLACGFNSHPILPHYFQRLLFDLPICRKWQWHQIIKITPFLNLLSRLLIHSSKSEWNFYIKFLE